MHHLINKITAYRLFAVFFPAERRLLSVLFAGNLKFLVVAKRVEVFIRSPTARRRQT